MRTIAIVLMLTAGALAQEHEHGTNGLPTWYDPACCSQQDCKPVPDTDVEFGANEHGNYARYKPTGHTFYRYQFKISQDERYHVCINPNADGNNGALCFYDRAGA